MAKRESMTSTGNNYPPPQHFMRDLRISLQFLCKEQSVVCAPVVPEVCTDQGAVQVGVIATLIDVLGGALSVRAVYPDWIATADLSIHTAGRARTGIVTATGSVLRAGRTTVVIQVDLAEETDTKARQSTPVGSAMMTFSRLPRRGDTPGLDLNVDVTETFQFGDADSGLARPYLDRIGLRVVDEAAGVVELDLNDYVRNSFDAVQGGILAVLADAAGQGAARHATGKPLTTSDLAVHYLSQGKAGPFRTHTTMLRTTVDTALTRVEVVDCGAEDRLVAVVMNTATA